MSEADLPSVASMFNQQTKPRGTIGRLVFLVAVFGWLPVSVGGQEIERLREVSLLPRTTGEALTVVPTDMPDVVCSIVESKLSDPAPSLTVLCPPQDIFAPLHVYLKLSWLKPADIPASARSVIATPKTPTRLRTNKSVIWVWLGVREKPSDDIRRMWVTFNGVADIALLTLPRER